MVDDVPGKILSVQIEQAAADAEGERARAVDLPVAHEDDLRDARAEPDRLRRVAAFAVEAHFAEVELIQIFVELLHAAADVQRDFVISRALNDEIAFADLAPFRSRRAGEGRRQRRARVHDEAGAFEARRSRDFGAEQEAARVHGEGARAEIDRLREADFLCSRARVVEDDAARLHVRRAAVRAPVIIPGLVAAGKVRAVPGNHAARVRDGNVVGVERRHALQVGGGIVFEIGVVAEIADLSRRRARRADVFEAARVRVVGVERAAAVAAFRRGAEHVRVALVEPHDDAVVARPLEVFVDVGDAGDAADRNAVLAQQRESAVLAGDEGLSRAEAIDVHAPARKRADEGGIRRERVVGRFGDDLVEADENLVIAVFVVARADVAVYRVSGAGKERDGRAGGGNAHVKGGSEVLRSDEPGAAVAAARGDARRTGIAAGSAVIVKKAAQVGHDGDGAARRAVRVVILHIGCAGGEHAGVRREILVERQRVVVPDRAGFDGGRGGERGDGNARRGRQRAA